MADDAVRVAIVQGAGDSFSSGHDLGTPEQLAERKRRGVPNEGLDFYENFRHDMLDLKLKWRAHPKPTIAMVRGYCIFGGWMVAASMDLIFASSDAKFLPGLIEYFSVPWDIGVKKAKEVIFGSRFLDPHEAMECGFVNRVYPPDELEVETRAYALRVAENSPNLVRVSKLALNKAWDLQGYRDGVEGALSDFLLGSQLSRGERSVEGQRALADVDLALRGLRGERPGLNQRRGRRSGPQCDGGVRQPTSGPAPVQTLDRPRPRPTKRSSPRCSVSLAASAGAAHVVAVQGGGDPEQRVRR